MVSALLITIGNELLSGKTINTNAAFLAGKLTQIGFIVKKIVTIPDEGDIVEKEIQNALKKELYNLIILTGGLGPTWDDSTAEFLSNALGVEYQLNEEALDIITRRYLELYNKKLVETPEITPARKKMAFLPQGSNPIDNLVGTAPGIYYEHSNNVKIYCFPGVPKEMRAMFENIQASLSEYLTKGEGGYFEEEFLSDFKDESLLAPYIEEVHQKFDVWIKSMPETYQQNKKIKIIISRTANSHSEAKDEVIAAKEYLEKKLLRIEGK